jgi:hypothetical protein
LLGKLYYRMFALGSISIGLLLVAASIFGPSPGPLRVAFDSPVGNRAISAALGIICFGFGLFMFRLPRRDHC